jgi:hypothetical protein
VNLTAFVNLRAGSFDLLPHLCRHLTALQVPRLIVAVNTTYVAGHESIEALSSPALPIVVHRYALDHGGGTNDDRMEDEQRAGAMAGISGWLMPLDLDEFPQFPAGLNDILNAADALGIRVIKGRLIDRFAKDGTLAPLRPDVPIDEQYPVRTEFTRLVLGGYTQKVMLCRSDVVLGTGHHNAHERHGTPIGAACDYTLEHFKWRAGLLERIHQTIDAGFASESYLREARLFLAMVERGPLPVTPI